MRKRAYTSAAMAALLLAVSAQAEVLVPRLDGVKIDADGSEWLAKAASVDAMMPIDTFDAKDLDARFQLAWDDRGLLLYVDVRDVDAYEASVAADLWQADCIELFVASNPGANEWVQYLIAPGMAADYPEPRQHFQDHRSEEKKGTKPELQLARKQTENGYAMEILIPWAAIGREAQAGDTVALQLYVNSKGPEGGSPRRKLVFFPKDGTHEDRSAMHSLLLTQDAASRVQAGVSASYERFRRVSAEAFGPASLDGKDAEITMRSADLDVPPTVVQVKFASNPAGRSDAKARLPLPAYDDALLTIKVGDQESEPIRLPSLALEKAKAILSEPVVCRPPVFHGETFPKPDFLNPDRAESLIGPYEIKYTYYNASFERVEVAKEPGRYGAVLEIHCGDGRTMRRFVSLYRTEKEVDWWKAEVPVRVQWPAGAGIDPIVAAEQGKSFDEMLKFMLVEGAFQNGMGAEVMAALHEMKPGEKPVNIMHDAESRGRAWWVQLKRRLYGADQRFTEPVDRPVLLDAPAEPKLRAGGEAEAGFLPGTKDKLDALLKEWAEKSGEAFTVCVVRNGVVVVDDAYGTRDGTPMTRQTPSIVYSISKAISGTAIMMAIDQGLVSLEDTPARFLPPFKDAQGKQPTIRQLFTHTAGMSGHWGDEQHDFEEVVAEHLPYLKVGQKQEYNGASLALGCKILEQVSGESLPEYYEKHIFTPLEMKDTTSTSCSWRTWSTAADLAKLGQMLLNGGTYGDLRFMSRDSFQMMLPHKLEKELSPKTTDMWGIGLSWMNPEKTVYGHGSASSSTFRVDPAEKLVITMARNAAGEKFGEYNKQFLEMIYASIQK